MTAQVKIELRRMCNAYVDRCTSWYITRFSTLFFLIGTEQSRVMSLLYNNKCDAWPVASFQFDTSFTKCRQFVLQNMRKLSLRHTVTVQNYAVWFITTCRFVKHYQQLTHHTAELLDNFLAMLLDAHSGCISRRMGVHRTDNSRNRWFFIVASWWMCDISTEKDYRFVEYLKKKKRERDW